MYQVQDGRRDTSSYRSRLNGFAHTICADTWPRWQNLRCILQPQSEGNDWQNSLLPPGPNGIPGICRGRSRVPAKVISFFRGLSIWNVADCRIFYDRRLRWVWVTITESNDLFISIADFICLLIFFDFSVLIWFDLEVGIEADIIIKSQNTKNYILIQMWQTNHWLAFSTLTKFTLFISAWTYNLTNYIKWIPNNTKNGILVQR